MKKSTIISLVFLFFFAIVFFLIHFLRTDLYFLHYPISRYAIGDYSTIMNIGFLCFGASEILLGLNLIRKHLKIDMVSILLILCGTGVVMVGVFFTDVGSENTTRGFLHFVGASLQFVFFPIMCFFAQKSYFSDTFRRITLWISIVMILFIPLMELCFYYKNWTLFTILEKINILIFIIWIFIMEQKMLKGSLVRHDRILKPERVNTM